METVCQWFLYFTAYSILGWACETFYCSVGNRKFVNRGFLNGPVCPVYGFGAVLVILLLQSTEKNLVALFLSGMMVTTVLEYLTSVLLEKLFHMKWWDYSRYKFQINGRVCLLNSLMFGGLSVILMRVLHPWISGLIARIPTSLLPWISLGILAVFAVDTVVTVRSILILTGKMQEIQKLLEEIKTRTEAAAAQLRAEMREKTQESKASLEARLDQYRLPEGVSLREFVEERRKKAAAAAKSGGMLHRRLLKAFPNLSSARQNDALDRLRETWKLKKSEKQKDPQ